MKNLSVFLLVVGVLGCAPVPTCPTGELLGSDNQCYSCTYGTPEYKSSEFGYCSTLSAGGVACCSTGFYNWGSVSCPKPGYPYLCDDGQCWNQPNGNGYLACVYAP
jgi:hypothetical protein